MAEDQNDREAALEAAEAVIVQVPDTTLAAGDVATLAELPGAIASAATVDEVAAITTAAETEAKRWKKTLIVVGSHRLPDGNRPVIVVEQRTVAEDGKVTLKTEGYPAKGDLYYRTDEAVKFPKDATVVTLGVDVSQNGLRGFTNTPGRVNVGPASPAYAAANLAFQRGAEEIEIVGLTDAEKEHLQPWIDMIRSAPQDSAATKVVLS